MAIPPGFQGWWTSNYPTLMFNPEWLNACVEYLQENDASCNQSTANLIKAVEKQLLSSDLSTSISLTSPILSSNTKVLSTSTPASATVEERIIYKGGKKRAVLFQVESVQDVSFSASSLLEIVKEKKEWSKLKAKGIEGGGDQGRDMRLDSEEADGGNLEEEEKKILAGGSGKEPKFPRGSSKLVLSDGKNRVVAFELQRINGLGLEEIRLGTKFLIHDVPFINGIMLLTSQNTILKGHDVEEFQQFKEWEIENSLRERLDMELIPKPDGGELAQQSPSPEPDIKPPPVPQQQQRRHVPPPTASRAGPSNSNSRAQPPSSKQKGKAAALQAKDEEEDAYFMDDSFDDLEIDYEALQLEAIKKSQSQRKPLANNGKGKGKAVIQDHEEDFDMNETEQEGNGEEEEEDWNVMNEIEDQQQQERQNSKQKSVSKSKGKSKVAVKSEPRSSGSAAVGLKGGGGGEPVEVLELDSDEEEDEKERPPAKRSSRGGAGGTGKKVTVLEIDDSSD